MDEGAVREQMGRRAITNIPFNLLTQKHCRRHCNYITIKFFNIIIIAQDKTLNNSYLFFLAFSGQVLFHDSLEP